MDRDTLIFSSFLFALFSFVFVQLYRREIDTNRQKLDSATDRRHLKAVLAKTATTQNYLGSVRRIEGIFRYIMGPKTSLQAFVTVWGVATYYPILALYVAWLTGAPNTNLEDHILSEGLSDSSIYLRAFNILLFPSLAIYLKISAANRKVYEWIENRDGFSIDTDTFDIIFGVVVSLAAFFYVTQTVSGSFSNIIAAFVVFSIIFSGTWLQFIPPVVALLRLYFSSNNHDLLHAQLLTVYFVVLPLCNALVDFISWAMTRYFLQKIANESVNEINGTKIFLDILLDVFVAILCLLILVALMTNAIVLSNIVATKMQLSTIPWQEYLLLALNDPLGDGLFVNLMIVTTLLPTFIHITFGLGGLVASMRPNFLKTASKIQIGRKGQSWADLGKTGGSLTLRDQVARQLVFRQVWILIASIPVAILLMLVWLTFAQILNYFHFGLGNVAICSTVWEHGHCPAFW